MILLCEINFENSRKQEKQLALTSFYCPSQEIQLVVSRKLI